MFPGALRALMSDAGRAVVEAADLVDATLASYDGLVIEVEVGGSDGAEGWVSQVWSNGQLIALEPGRAEDRSSRRLRIVGWEDELLRVAGSDGRWWSLPLSANDLMAAPRAHHSGATMTAHVHIHDYPNGPRRVTYEMRDGVFTASAADLVVGGAPFEGLPEAEALFLDMPLRSAVALFAGVEAPDDYVETIGIGGHLLLLGCLVGVLCPQADTLWNREAFERSQAAVAALAAFEVLLSRME